MIMRNELFYFPVTSKIKLLREWYWTNTSTIVQYANKYENVNEGHSVSEQ